MKTLNKKEPQKNNTINNIVNNQISKTETTKHKQTKQ